ncbi:MAG: hypothetical protein QM617_14015 [Comamonas sp.]
MVRTHACAPRIRGIVTLHGPAAPEIPRLAQALGVQAVWVGHDDEPATLNRDARVLPRGTEK